MLRLSFHVKEINNNINYYINIFSIYYLYSDERYNG